MSWNETYELLPEDDNNPGRGADAIRELKGQVRTRQEVEHFFGPNEDDLASRFGLHKEGSARVLSTDPYTGNAGRDPILDDQLNAGRVDINTQERDTGDLKRYDGELEADAPAGKFDKEDAQYKKLSALVYTDDTGATLGWNDIFDYDRFVDLKFDQTIDGRKTFKLEPQLPESPTIKVGSSYESIADWFTATMRNASGAEKAITAQVGNVADQLDNMMLSNILDPDDPLVTGHLKVLNTSYVAGGRVNKTINVTTIKAAEIEGDSIKGAVYV